MCLNIKWTKDLYEIDLDSGMACALILDKLSVACDYSNTDNALTMVPTDFKLNTKLLKRDASQIKLFMFDLLICFRDRIKHKARRNIIQTLAIVGACFVVCHSGSQILFCILNLGFNIDLNATYYRVCVLLSFLNCTVNPFIYALNYRQFQVGLFLYSFVISSKLTCELWLTRHTHKDYNLLIMVKIMITILRCLSILQSILQLLTKHKSRSNASTFQILMNGIRVSRTVPKIYFDCKWENWNCTVLVHEAKMYGLSLKW